MNSSHSAVIRCIGVFKLVKAASLLVLGFGILRLIHKDVAAQLESWLAALGFDPGSRFVNHAISKAAHLTPARFKEFGIASFVYAGLFLTEGIGLCLLKHWAEWFTVVITSSLLPFEVYEIFHHGTVIKVLVLILNVSVVIYLLYRIRHEGRAAPNTKVVQIHRAQRR